MTDAALPPEDLPARKGGKLPLLLGLALALPAAAGGFWAGYQGLIPLPGSQAAATAPSGGEVAYIALDPVVVTLAPGGKSRHLRLTAQLEVEPTARDAVEKLRPRIMDLMNSYLSALTLSELEAQPALVRLRAHLLRRITLVAGDGQVRDLLITEFVLN